ncbi:hypothetical protein J6590_029662 [Homalodisca vitripennis]|nr:hypothetical protein J6590_029662 [Homalodisca vitripennis]
MQRRRRRSCHRSGTNRVPLAEKPFYSGALLLPMARLMGRNGFSTCVTSAYFYLCSVSVPHLSLQNAGCSAQLVLASVANPCFERCRGTWYFPTAPIIASDAFLCSQCWSTTSQLTMIYHQPATGRNLKRDLWSITQMFPVLVHNQPTHDDLSSADHGRNLKRDLWSITQMFPVLVHPQLTMIYISRPRTRNLKRDLWSITQMFPVLVHNQPTHDDLSSADHGLGI